MALFRVFNNIIVNLNSGIVCLLNLLEMIAPFGSIDHAILLESVKVVLSSVEVYFNGWILI